MYIIEEKEQLFSFSHKSCFVYPILDDNRNHPVNSNLIALYILFPDETKYIININHPDSFNIEFKEIYNYLKQLDDVLCYDKKILLYFFPKLNKKLTSILLCNFLTNKKININLSLYDVFYSKYSQHKNINYYIPLSKHYEIGNTFDSLVDFNLPNNPPSGYEYYIENIIPTFFWLEKQGIMNTNNEIEYGLFNLYTLTGRPSFTHNGINYLALTKDDKARYKPLNDCFFEFDYSSYHLFLLAKLIDYKFPTKNPHKYLAQYYFPGEKIVGELYKQAKQITFRILYGGRNEYDIEFFNKVNNLTKKLYTEFLENGYISSFLSKKHIYIDGDDNSPHKILNYYIQSFETEYNSIKIKDIFSLLKNKKSKLVLYTYDSFLIDYSNEDGVSLLKQIKSILTEDDFSLKIKYGTNLSNLITKS